MSHIQNLERLVPDLRQRRVLDLGSGRGGVLAAFVAAGCEAVGLEPNPEYISLTQELSRQRGLELRVVQGVAETMPFPDGAFRFINCNEVTEHVDDVRALLAECRRVLASDGKMYVSFHNRFGAYDYHYHLWGVNWLPRRFADQLLSLLGRGKPTTTAAGRQSLGAMHYVTYRQALRLLAEAEFTAQDTRELKLNDPSFGSSMVVWVRRLHCQRLVRCWLRYAASTFHFLATKKPGA